MIRNAITSKYKRTNNDIKNEINIHGKRILKSKEELNRLGRISKANLDTANKNIREAMNLNQWRNTKTVTDWFKGIRNKHLHKFIIIDIK